MVFLPQSHTYAAAGVTDPQGNFKLRTFEPGDGAAAGSYQVLVRKSYFVNDVEYQALPEKYANGKDSGLTADIQLNHNNEFSFELKN